MFPSPQGTTTRVLPKHTVTFILRSRGAPVSLRPRAPFLLLFFLLSSLHHGRPPAGSGAQPLAAAGQPPRAPSLRGRLGDGRAAQGSGAGPAFPRERGRAASRGPLTCCGAARCLRPPARRLPRRAAAAGGAVAALPPRSGGVGRCSGAGAAGRCSGAARTGRRNRWAGPGSGPGRRGSVPGGRKTRAGLVRRKAGGCPVRALGVSEPSAGGCGGFRLALPCRRPGQCTRGRTGTKSPAKSSGLSAVDAFGCGRALLVPLLGELPAAAPPQIREYGVIVRAAGNPLRG